MKPTTDELIEAYNMGLVDKEVFSKWLQGRLDVLEELHFYEHLGRNALDCCRSGRFPNQCDIGKEIAKIKEVLK